jgi:hypothetical protein
MSSKRKQADDSAELRRRAEGMTRRNADSFPEDLEALSPEEIQQMLYELRVHQI